MRKRKSMFARRGRVLSKEGRDLLRAAYAGFEPPPEKGREGRRLFCGLFTTKYDVDLDECVRLFRDGSKALLASTVRDGKLSPEWMDNAITNVIRLVLEEKGKPLPPTKVKGNLRWYLNVALKAKETKDHNTAILLRSALAHSCLDRLGLMSKNMKRSMATFDEAYGTFQTCQAEHVREILRKDPTCYSPRRGEIPSAMVVDMHLNRNKEHAKAFRQIGKMPQGIEDASSRLKERLALILRRFDRAGEMIPLYTEASGLTMPALFKLSSAVEQKKRRFTSCF